MDEALAYLAAGLVAAGRGACDSDPPGHGRFGPITADNRRVIVQEWLAEAFTMWGVLTTFTGTRTPVIWFKVCPVLLGTSALLLVVASFV